MVAALRLLDQVQVLVQRLLRFPRGAVDPLQAGVVLVAAPVRRRAAGELERRNVARGRDVRPAAQIAPNTFAGTGIEVVVGGQFVAADFHHLGIAGLVVDELELVRLVGELFARLLFGLVDAAGEQLAVLDDLAHPLLERLQILGGERLGHVEVVVEAVGDRRPDPELGVGKHVLHRLRQHVGGRVADDAAAVLGVGGDGHDLGVGVRRPAQVAQPAVGVAHDDDRIRLAPARQARVADRGRRGRPGRHPDRGGAADGCGGGHREISNRSDVLDRGPCYRGESHGLAGPQPHEQRLAVGQHHVAVGEPALDEDLAAVDTLDAGVDLQLLFDRRDLAVVDMQEGGALVRAAR